MTIIFFGTAFSERPVERRALFIDIDARERRDFGAGGDDDVLRFKDLFALVARDDHAAGTIDAACAEKYRDLVLLHDEGDAGRETGDGVGFLFQHVVEVELEARHLDAEAGEILGGGLVEFGGMQHRFRGDAADIEAGAAELVALFDEGDLEAKLAAARGAVVAAGAGADDDDVVALAHGKCPSQIDLRELYAPRARGQQKGRWG
jgi:hypothetical protein